ncbi:MAG: hypothetical protein FWF82_07250, partial [Oscillospiraceae bacterium]|nr:hypothetical protein [Oscillospiraceae bacterium]
VFASGNRKMNDIVKRFYQESSAGVLIDVEKLEFPANIEIIEFDYPENASFTDNVIPHVNTILQQSAENIVSGATHRNLRIGGANIQKDSVRILAGACKINYTYAGKDYSLYLSSDGSKTFSEETPTDDSRQKILLKMEQEHRNLCKRFDRMSLLALFTLGLYCFSSDYISVSKRNAQKSASQQAISDYANAVPNMKKEFVQSNRRLKGIYENI